MLPAQAWRRTLVDGKVDQRHRDCADERAAEAAVQVALAECAEIAHTQQRPATCPQEHVRLLRHSLPFHQLRHVWPVYLHGRLDRLLAAKANTMGGENDMCAMSCQRGLRSSFTTHYVHFQLRVCLCRRGLPDQLQ